MVQTSHLEDLWSWKTLSHPNVATTLSSLVRNTCGKMPHVFVPQARDHYSLEDQSQEASFTPFVWEYQHIFLYENCLTDLFLQRMPLWNLWFSPTFLPFLHLPPKRSLREVCRPHPNESSLWHLLETHCLLDQQLSGWQSAPHQPDDLEIHQRRFRPWRNHFPSAPPHVVINVLFSWQDGVDFFWCVRLIMSSQKKSCLSRDNELWIIRSQSNSWNMWSWFVNWQASSRSRCWVKAKVTAHSSTHSSTRNTVSHHTHVTTPFMVTSFLGIKNSCWRNTNSLRSWSVCWINTNIRMILSFQNKILNWCNTNLLVLSPRRHLQLFLSLLPITSNSWQPWTSHNAYVGFSAEPVHPHGWMAETENPWTQWRTCHHFLQQDHHQLNSNSNSYYTQQQLCQSENTW